MADSAIAVTQPVMDEQLNGDHVCTLLSLAQFCGYSTSHGQEPVIQQSKCKSRVKTSLLFAGFFCIVSCFVFASLGYIELKSCPTNPQNPNDKSCDESSRQFLIAQNYRLAAALFFIIGMCVVVLFVWLVKRDSNTTQLIRAEVVVSNVTEEGLLKTPAPQLPHPRSQLHHTVYDELYDLPGYELAVKLKSRLSGTGDGVTCGSIKNIKGVRMESVAIQVDEDDIHPPPSYSQALRLQMDSDTNQDEQNRGDFDVG